MRVEDALAALREHVLVDGARDELGDDLRQQLGDDLGDELETLAAAWLRYIAAHALEAVHEESAVARLLGAVAPAQQRNSRPHPAQVSPVR